MAEVLGIEAVVVELFGVEEVVADSRGDISLTFSILKNVGLSSV